MDCPLVLDEIAVKTVNYIALDEIAVKTVYYIAKYLIKQSKVWLYLQVLAVVLKICTSAEQWYLHYF